MRIQLWVADLCNLHSKPNQLAFHTLYLTRSSNAGDQALLWPIEKPKASVMDDETLQAGWTNHLHKNLIPKATASCERHSYLWGFLRTLTEQRWRMGIVMVRRLRALVTCLWSHPYRASNLLREPGSSRDIDHYLWTTISRRFGTYGTHFEGFL